SRRGKGARRHGARMAPPSRPRTGPVLAAVPLHPRSDHRHRRSHRRWRRKGVEQRRVPWYRQPAREERPMTHLHRELAPISDNAWTEIEKEASRTLRTFLAARQVVDFSGPHGWDYSADSLGRLERVPGPVDGVDAGIRAVQPLV